MVTHVTDDVTVTWPPKVPWGSTVGYPSDSLASCYVTYPTDNYDVSTLSVIISHCSCNRQVEKTQNSSFLSSALIRNNKYCDFGVMLPLLVLKRFFIPKLQLAIVAKVRCHKGTVCYSFSVFYSHWYTRLQTKCLGIRAVRNCFSLWSINDTDKQRNTTWLILTEPSRWWLSARRPSVPAGRPSPGRCPSRPSSPASSSWSRPSYSSPSWPVSRSDAKHKRNDNTETGGDEQFSTRVERWKRCERREASRVGCQRSTRFCCCCRTPW